MRKIHSLVLIVLFGLAQGCANNAKGSRADSYPLESMVEVSQNTQEELQNMQKTLQNAYVAQNTQEELEKAYNAWQNGEFSKAIRLYENACYDGNMGACHAIGTLYFQGSGVAQNYSMSASYYNKACEGGIYDVV